MSERRPGQEVPAPSTQDAYLLVTPARDEEASLPLVADAITHQVIRPKVWVLVDDGSADRTPVILRDLEERHDWIVGIRMPEHERDVHGHYAEVCQKGFDAAMAWARLHHVDFGFIGLVDADTVVEPAYFQKLLQEFGRDPRLGLASGSLFYRVDDAPVPERGEVHSARGSGRLWTKDCFIQTEGYYACDAPPDVISNAKARIRGFRVRQFRSIVAVQSRFTSSSEGIWRGYRRKGSSWYFLNAHPLLALMNAAFFTTQRPRYRSVAFLHGYAVAFLNRSVKIDDAEIQRYFWSERGREVICNAIGRDERQYER